MTYKGNETFGTSLGGFCSCCAFILISIYMTINFWAFFFESREYNAQSKTKIFGYGSDKAYTLTPMDMIPVVVITEYDNYETVSVNDPDMWYV